MLFNIYYINYPKVYEIKMMLNNLVSVNKSIEKDKDGELNANIEASFGLGFLKLLKGEANVGTKAKGSISNKVIINDVSLSLINDFELRTVKLFNSGAFKNLPIPNTEGFDITSLLNSMFKDYAYKITGTFSNSSDQILIKIPITFDNEFESSYNVDDLFIGRVSVLGIYKGKVPLNRLKNTFEYFSELGAVNKGLPQVDDDDEIHDSQYPRDANSESSQSYWSKGCDSLYHYIDLLAIVQNIRSNAND